ncbi:MAG: carbohydrate binding family 9 domain-containing protein [Gemmatimonadota bacterium]|nr:carbohydrate binding family 9 domain-containing protein [Gemmatimonadota bacterium]
MSPSSYRLAGRGAHAAYTLSAITFALLPAIATAQSGEQHGQHSVPAPVARATQRAGPINLDGRLDEEAWRAAEPITAFTQIDPNEGEAATQRTEVRIVYDDAALWVGARMYDTLGAAGVRTRLVRRDQDTDSDWFEVILDTYHDHLGRAFFQVNPSGVKYDALGQGGANADASWDPIWEVATRIDSAGWVAEMRIPLSQLRFSRDPAQTWGMQLRRNVTRLNEQTQWSYWRKNEAGGPSRYGHLEGISIGARPRHLEIMPYVVARSSFVRGDAADPFHDPSEYTYRAGGDVKYLLTSNLTLDATINPDFGQVEVDPAVVNLSAFETFFPEKRPFFVEGAGIFSFGGASCYFCSNVSSLGLFYSRRIGRQPQGSWQGTWADVPENTTILGAAKITGRTRNGVSVGILNALTREESASVIDTSNGGERLRFRTPVEPLANYFVGRARKDFRGGNLVVGGIATSVLRDLPNEALAQNLTRRAEAVGTDLRLTWHQRRYSFWTQFALSSVAGDSSAILRVQRSSARYFHRPDMDRARLDSGRTRLAGYGGYARLAKDAGDWLWETQVNYRSPGFEVNDIAFLTRADYVWMNANLARQWTTPGRWYRSIFATAGGQQQFNYDGDLIDRQIHGFFGPTLSNYWDGSLFFIYRPATLEDRLTRGGPVVMRGTSRTTFLNLETDSRKRVVFGTSPTYGWNDEGDYGYSVNLDATIKPASNVSLTLGPAFSRSSSPNAYVATVSQDTAGNPFTDAVAQRFYGRHYIFANIVQRTFSMNTRLNVTFTPALTLELFAQPLIASADYSRLKEFDAPRSLAKSVFGEQRGSIQTTGTGWDTEYIIDPDDTPGGAFRVRPGYPLRDFNFRSLRGNAVVRWEYRPGSTLFLVWTQQRDDLVADGNFDFARDRGALFDANPDNVFLVKLTYWLGR